MSGEAKDTEKEEGVKNYFWGSNVGNGNSFRDRTFQKNEEKTC